MDDVIEFRDGDGKYELTENGDLIGVAVYRDSGERRVFTHTEIDADYAGRGLASALVKYALDDVRARGKSVVAVCPMVASFIGKFPEYDDLLDHPVSLDLG
jgi:predicted GNAT family acetyltransferase